MATAKNVTVTVDTQSGDVQTENTAQTAAQMAQARLLGPRVAVDLAETLAGAIAAENGQLAVVRADGGLNLRSGPALSFPVAEVLQDGTPLAVLTLPYVAEVSGWGLVHTGQRTGWVDIRWIEAVEPAAAED